MHRKLHEFGVMHVSVPVYCEPKLQEPRQHPPPYNNIGYHISFAPLLRQRWRMVLPGCLGFACEQQITACSPYAAHPLQEPLALESETAKGQQQTHVESILSKTGLQTGVLDTLLSWSYICLCMVARPPFVFKFITLSRCTFFHTIWRTTRHIGKFVLTITSQTQGNKVP